MGISIIMMKYIWTTKFMASALTQGNSRKQNIVEEHEEAVWHEGVHENMGHQGTQTIMRT